MVTWRFKLGYITYSCDVQTVIRNAWGWIALLLSARVFEIPLKTTRGEKPLIYCAVAVFLSTFLSCRMESHKETRRNMNKLGALRE